MKTPLTNTWSKCRSNRGHQGRYCCIRGGTYTYYWPRTYDANVKICFHILKLHFLVSEQPLNNATTSTTAIIVLYSSFWSCIFKQVKIWFCRFYCNYRDVKHFFECLFLIVTSKSRIEKSFILNHHLQHQISTPPSIVIQMVLMVLLFLLLIDCIWRVFVPLLLYSKTSEDKSWNHNFFVYDDRGIIQYNYI